MAKKVLAYDDANLSKISGIDYQTNLFNLGSDPRYEKGSPQFDSRRVKLAYLKGHTFEPNGVTGYMIFPMEGNVDTFFDIGCGVGPIAIWLLKEMGVKEVYASDISSTNVRAARINQRLYGLENRLHVLEGSLFDKIPEGVLADGVSLDIAGVPSVYAYGTGCYPGEVPAGGDNGDELIIDALGKAPKYLKKGGKIWFPIGAGLTGSSGILRAARESFGEENVRNAYGEGFMCEVPLGFQDQYDKLERACIEAGLPGIPDHWELHSREKGRGRGLFYSWDGSIWVAQKV